MTSDVPFCEAERLFDSIMSRIEAHLEEKSPGMSGFQYHFAELGELREHRRIVVSFQPENGQAERADIFMPGAALGYLRLGEFDMRLELTGQEYDTFLALVWLGACLGFWPVDGLMTFKGESAYLTRGPWGKRQMISPMAILAAFAGGELEDEWKNREKHIENAWFLWQARHSAQSAHYDKQIKEQGGGEGTNIWKSDEGPEYI